MNVASRGSIKWGLGAFGDVFLRNRGDVVAGDKVLAAHYAVLLLGRQGKHEYGLLAQDLGLPPGGNPRKRVLGALSRGEIIAVQEPLAFPHFQARPPGGAVVEALGPAPEEDADLTHWIEIELVDDQGNPVPDARYQVKAPDGAVRSGRTGATGRAKERGLVAGSCVVSFPDLDGDECRMVS